MSKEKECGVTDENKGNEDMADVSCSGLLLRLKELEGTEVDYLYRGKYRRMKMVAVQLTKGVINDRYEGNIGDVRLNYTDGKIREWEGFWTNKIDRIKIT